MRRMLVLASALLAVALPAGAQTLRTGVSQSQCSALGGRFTATSTAGQYTVDTGECYVPPRSSGTTTFQVPRGGGNAGAVLGGVAAMLSLGAAVADMAGGFPAATSPTPGAQTHSLTAPGNTAALQTVPNASQPGPSNDPDSLAMLAALDSLGRTRPMNIIYRRRWAAWPMKPASAAPKTSLAAFPEPAMARLGWRKWTA